MIIFFLNFSAESTLSGNIDFAGTDKHLNIVLFIQMNLNSTKSMTGHLLGAAGVIETISCILSIQHGIVPPTINHFTDDENIDGRLDFTFNNAVKKDVKIAMSNTFGFGGHNACVLFKKL